MGGGLVNDSSSETEGGDGINTRPSYSEVFESQFPYYLAFGMTAEQYWDGDPALAIAYRKARELKKEWDNEQAWLNGLYVYNALCAASPLFRAFAKRGTKASPYIERPLPVTKQQAEKNHVDAEKQTFEKGKKFMEVFALNHNKRFKQQEVRMDG